MSVLMVGASLGGVTTRRLEDDGSAVWTADHGGFVNAIAARGGVVTTGGDVYGGVTTRQYDALTGAEITTGWPVNHGATVNDVVMDDAGNVYTGGYRTAGNVTTRKYNSAGTLQWSADHGGTVYGIAVDSAGNVYTTGDFVTDSTTRKYNSAGTLQWSANHNAATYAIAVDSAGNVYTTGVRDGPSNATTRKYNSAGSLQWSRNHGEPGFAIAVDSAGNVYTGGVKNSNTGYYSIRKYNSNSTLLWSSAIGASAVYALALDYDEAALYVGADNPFSAPWQNLFKLAPGDGAEITTGWPQAHGESGQVVAGLAWRQILDPAVAPGLPLAVPVALAFPTGIHAAPSLAVPLALALPAPFVPPAPPDLAGRPVATQYRVWLTGMGSEPLALPVAALHCTRRRGDSTWLALAIPTYTVALATAIQARIGGEVVVDSGYRTAGGSEVFGLFLRATLTEVQSERTRIGAALTLTARVIPTAFTAQTRTLTGIRQQNRVDGRTTVVCDVDPLLRPGDTVIAAQGVVFTVLTLRYRLSPAGAEMTVTETL